MSKPNISWKFSLLKLLSFMVVNFVAAHNFGCVYIPHRELRQYKIILYIIFLTQKFCEVQNYCRDMYCWLSATKCNQAPASTKQSNVARPTQCVIHKYLWENQFQFKTPCSSIPCTSMVRVVYVEIIINKLWMVKLLPAGDNQWECSSSYIQRMALLLDTCLAWKVSRVFSEEDPHMYD